MTIYSARKQMEQLGDLAGYCVPLSIDSLLRSTELPVDFYTFCHEEEASPTGTHTRMFATLLREFFHVEPIIDLDESVPALAKFTAFGGSEQAYFKDAPYDYGDEMVAYRGTKITPTQLRMQELLNRARTQNCLVLASTNNGAHVVALDMVDPGASESLQRYLIRDNCEIQNNRSYYAGELSGLQQAAVATRRRFSRNKPNSDNFAPLPSLHKNYFPDGAESPELVILPPEPEPR